MSSIKLPKLPLGSEFEEFISSHFQSSGFYVERNVIAREEVELFELDLITSNYFASPPEIMFLEAKSGSWGFTDIFKLRGWMHYLNIGSCALIVKESRQKFDFIKEKAKKMGIDIIHADGNNLETYLKNKITSPKLNDLDLQVWRFSNWIEWVLVKRLTDLKKSNRSVKRFEILHEYHSVINHETFLTENIVDRVIKVYEIFFKYPHLSACVANEMETGNFDENCKMIPANIFKNAFINGDFNELQISSFLEYRARLALLKALVDYQLYKDAQILHRITKKDRPPLGDNWEIVMEVIPQSFWDRLNKISKHKYFYRYPIFWQWFMWFFGGFILKDHEQQEIEFLSEKAGIPVEEVPNAFEAYNILFPSPKGWFIEPTANSSIRTLKMFPMPFLGIGAFLRSHFYGESTYDNEKLKLTGLHTIDDLKRWNNHTHDLLERSSKNDKRSNQGG